MPVLISTVVVGSLYIVWDAWVVHRGDWDFTPQWTGTWRLANLPAGEWVFFVAVPYATLFLFEVFGTYFGRENVWVLPRFLTFLVAGGFLIAAYWNRRRNYTMLAMLSSAIFLFLQGFLQPDFWARRDVLLVVAASFGTFILVNGIYTRLPTIRYNPKSVLGIQLGTIPLEDFFYNFGMIGLYVLVYLTVKYGVKPWV